MLALISFYEFLKSLLNTNLKYTICKEAIIKSKFKTTIIHYWKIMIICYAIPNPNYMQMLFGKI